MSLEPVGEELWMAEGPLVSFYGFPYNTRMVVARLPSGGLWVWSPVALSDELRQAVEALGPPRHLVSPNPLHYLYLEEWAAAYPQARLWGPSQTIEKCWALSFEPALDDEPPEAFEGIIDQAWLRGSPFMEEILFFHRPSRTAILADASENFSKAFLRAHWPWWARPLAWLWGIVEPYGYAPLEWRLSFTNRRLARAAVDTAIAWAPEAVIMAHGEWQRTNGTAYLKKAFAWVPPSAAATVNARS